MNVPLFIEENGIYIADWPLQSGSKPGVNFIAPLTTITIDQQNLAFPISRTIFLETQHMGGNHVHERKEIYIPLTASLELYWVYNHIQYKKSLELGKAYLISRPIPHAMLNTSVQTGIFVEYADKESTSTPYSVIS